MLGISRQHVNRMMQTGEFRTLRALGDRPILVVKHAEVLKVRDRRAAEKAKRVKVDT
jgi:hypothetical protein